MPDKDRTIRILSSAGAKLIVSRTVESVTQHIGAACLVCAAAMCGRLFSAGSAMISTIVLAVLAAIGLAMLSPRLALLLCPPVHRGVSLGMFTLIASSWTIVSLAGGGIFVLPMCVWILCSAVVVGTIVEVAFVLNVGARKLAASWLDEKYRLAELLSTSCDLLARDEDSPVADVVFSQAADASKKFGASGDWMFRMGSAGWLASVGAAALLALTIAGVSSGKQDDAYRLAKSLMELSRQDRQEVANKMLIADSSTPEGQALRQAGIVLIEESDPSKLAEMIKQLEDAGYEKRDFIPGHILARIDKPDESLPSGDWKYSSSDGGLVSPESQPATPMSVYVGPGDYSAAAQDKNSVAPRHATIDFSDAWTAARRAALLRVDSEKISPDRRRLVREYFAAGE